MRFWIQASSPRFTYEFDSDDESLEEAIETIFPLWAENLYFIWNNIHIPLSYKYDVSVMIMDILDMLENVEAKTVGDIKIRWSSDTFNCEWSVQWSDEELKICSEWKNVVGNVEEVLTDSGDIRMARKEFLSEWKKVLLNVVKGLYECKYVNRLESDINRLEDVLSRIENDGILYESK